MCYENPGVPLCTVSPRILPEAVTWAVIPASQKNVLFGCLADDSPPSLLGGGSHCFLYSRCTPINQPEAWLVPFWLRSNRFFTKHVRRMEFLVGSVDVSLLLQH